MEKRQREFLLRQQMSAIRKELGEDDEENVVEEYRTQDRRDAGMPEDVANEAERELDRLERTREQIARARLDPHVARLDDSSCRGTCAPTTTSTSPRRARSSTPTTPAWRT